MRYSGRILFLFSTCVSLLIGTGCDTTSRGEKVIDVGPDSPASIFQPPGRSRFNDGEKISIVLSDFPNGPVKYPAQVSDDGNVVLHLNQVFMARGKTPTELQAEIHGRYVPSYYPRMTVQVSAEEQFFFVQGHVAAAGRYPYSSGMTVMKAITTARGFDPFAKKFGVVVTRQNGQKFRVNCDKAKTDARYDLPIFPGDRMNVPRRLY